MSTHTHTHYMDVYFLYILSFPRVSGDEQEEEEVKSIRKPLNAEKNLKKKIYLRREILFHTHRYPKMCVLNSCAEI